MWYVGIALVSIAVTFLICNIFYSIKIKKNYKLGKKEGIDEFLKLLFQDSYQSKVKEFKVLNKYSKPEGIVFIGDSITQSYNVYEFFPDLLVYNRGIGGDTTKGLLNRLEESVYEINPKTVIMLIGTNDYPVLNATENDIYENVKRIVREIKLKLPNTDILLQSIYPISDINNPKINPLSVGNRNNDLINKTNELLKSIDDVKYLDINSILKDENDYLDLKYTVEGLHINEEGYKLITSCIKGYLY